MTIDLPAYQGPTPVEHRPAQKRLALAIVAIPVLSTLLMSVAGLASLLAPTSGSAAAMIQRLPALRAAGEPLLDNPLTISEPAPKTFTAPLIAQVGLTAAMPGFRNGVAPEDPIQDFISALDKYPTTVKYEIARDDTLIGIFASHGVPDVDVQSMTAALASAKLRPESWMKQGQTVSMKFDPYAAGDAERPLIAATIKVGAIESVAITRDKTGTYHAARVTADLTPQEKLAFGTITTSLSSSAKAAGVAQNLVAQLTDIYAYDVDFQRDIHPNDTFEVLYTEYVTADGDAAPGRGDVLFSRLNFKGKSKSYYRYTHADGKTTDYYDETGANARKFLMKTPISGARLSSGFGLRRHPILGYNKMHRGVDFAAPRGTPIYAAGDGTVLKASRFGTFGNYIKIKHANGYSTAYAHLNGYAKGIKAGVQVSQGQVIGYVGTTGRSTGAHLHYEVAKNDTPINPMSIKVPTGTKLAGAELKRFRTEVGRIEEARAAMSPETRIAQAQPTDKSVSR